jgi:anti-anti-sigma factor
MLRIKERPSGDVMVLDLRGRMTTGVPEIEFGNTVRSVLFRGYRKVLVNLEAATSSDPSGVSAFLGALIDAGAVGAELRLVHVTRRIADLGIIVALHRYFRVYESERDAMASFGAGTAPHVSGREPLLEPAAAV